MRYLLGGLAAVVVAVGAAAAAAQSAGTTAASRLVADVRQALDAAGWDADRWGVMVASLASRETLFAHNAERPLTPASNMKLFTTAAALHYLGPEHRYATYVTALGPVRDGVVEGDILLYGTGDPTIADRFFESKLTVWEALADSLVELGVERVRGDIVGDGSYFEGLPVGSGWDTAYSAHRYAAPVSALSFNENIVTLRITPGPADGEPAEILYVPGGRVDLINRTETGAGRPPLQVRRPDYFSPPELEGRVPRGGSAIWRAVPVNDPPAFAASVFVEVLESRGIAVDGASGSVAAPAASPITSRRVFAPAFDGGAPIQVLAVHRSPPLREILAIINQRSHNLYAESVIRLVGRVVGGHGSVEGGAQAVSLMLADAGLDHTDLHIDDGSGLSSLNRATPQSIIELLAHMRETPHWEEYRATLPEAAVSRGLRRMQETLAAGNLRAKTGTINRVSALSGYVQARNGELLAFSILSNDVPSTWRAKRVEDRIGARLAGFDRPAPGGGRLAATVADEGAEGDDAGEASVALGPEPGPESGEAAEATEAEATEAEAERERYVIRRGDTLEGIARRQGVSLPALRAANPGVDPRRLIPGRSIDIPREG